MKKTPELEFMAEPERRQLISELRQMWRSIPKHARANARRLGGGPPGKRQQFRVAVVQEDACFLDYNPGVSLRASLIDEAINGEDAKRLKVQVQSDGRVWQNNDFVYTRRFRSPKHLNQWLVAIEKHVRLHLSERLWDTCFFIWDEAIAKASSEHGVRKVDLTALAKTHLKDMRKDKSKALQIKPGAKKGSKHSKVHLSRKQVEIDLPKFIRDNGEETTRKEAAERFGLNNEKALDRALAQHGKGWRKLKLRATMK